MSNAGRQATQPISVLDCAPKKDELSRDNQAQGKKKAEPRFRLCGEEAFVQLMI
jgi:hypothetical protein